MQEKYVTIGENKIRYLESESNSKNLVLIHGLGASAERWSRLFPYIDKKYRIIAPDLIGFGYSDKPLVDYTVEFFREFLKSFLESIGIDKCFLVGSSLGGQICTYFTADCPDFVNKLVLISPSGVMKESTPALDAYIMAALYPNEDTAKNAFEMMEGSGKEPDPHIVQSFIERMQLPNAKMAFMSTLLGLKNEDSITEKLKKINKPTLIMWGGNDPVIPISFSKQFLSYLSNAKFIELENTGHTPYVQNSEHFAKILHNFLKKS